MGDPSNGGSATQQEQQPHAPTSAGDHDLATSPSASAPASASNLLPSSSTAATSSSALSPTSVAASANNVAAIKSEPVESGQITQPSPSTLTPSRLSPSRAAKQEASQSNSTTPQPPTGGASRASQMSSADEDATMADQASYGTRSRNRTAGSRPNYAEDQDMDFEYTAPAKSESKRTSAAAEPKRTADAQPAGFRAVNDAAHGIDAPIYTDIAATSSSNGITKKRKAAAPPQSSTSSSAILRKSTQFSRRQETHTNMLFFHKSGARLNREGQLVADDGTIFSVNDQAYLVCEPPGEPYYLCRIMEFLHAGNDPNNPVDCLRVNWFYRSRDVQRYNNDTRLVYSTMHSDICPLTSLRGRCTISHRSEINDLDQYRKEPHHFWFNQCFDRFIRRFYEVIPTSQVINVPEKVKKALDDRWKYVIVEASRVKELTSAVKLCKRCSQYCASHDSVDCAICGNAYHMNCVRPPLPKKPSRGFAWACGPCGRKQEKQVQARLTPQAGSQGDEAEEEIVEEEDEEKNLEDSTRAPSPDSNDEYSDKHPATQAEIALAKQWQMRYLGIHCRVEDALQYDDRAIYPRASSRLGPRHQANVNVWHGRPVELVKPADIKKKYVKTNSHKKDAKLSKETLAAIEADRAEKAKRPKWVMDQPSGYVARGEDYPNDDPRNTATLLFRMPDPQLKHGKTINGNDIDPVTDQTVDEYVVRARGLSRQLRVSENGVNLLDKALSLLVDFDFDWDKAYNKLKTVDRGKDLKEPIFTHDDLKKFEDGVQKYGSEHRLIKQHMKTNLPISSIIRFYYLWKKTDRGRSIWDNYGGRKSTKLQKQHLDAATKQQQELADDADDSAFDSSKAAVHKKEFQCKFCNRRHSPVWRKAPNVAPGQTAAVEKGSTKDKASRPILALCMRCSNLWRRYAIEWEDLDEVGRKVAQGGGKAWKRRIDEELLKELQAESNMDARELSEPSGMTPEAGIEPAKKKAKTGDAPSSKAKPVPVRQPTPPPPPIVPEPPKWRQLPCFVCNTVDSSEFQPISCTHCKLTVHKHCYGLTDKNIGGKWVCDQCTNDRTPLVSTEYSCTLCTIDTTPRELWESAKVTHKKKTDRDREKERLEKELLDVAKQEYSKRQTELNRAQQPREPLKKTDGNNWVHVLCAVWTPEIKFSNAKLLERAEGFSTIAQSKFETMCKLCKSARHGACVSCLACHGNFHVACAFEAGYTFGFDITPVKGSRKDQITTVTLGQETGYMTPAIWCREHTVKTIVHPMTEVVDDHGTTALELYVENYKQADQTLTGTARKANLLSQSIRGQNQGAHNAATNRRVSTISTGTSAAARKARNSIIGGVAPDDVDSGSPIATKDMTFPEQPDKKCAKCGVEVSPKWWSLPADHASQHSSINGILNKPLGINGINPVSENGDKPAFECHKCHHKAGKPSDRIPLSPKPLNINLDWPPCLSDPAETHSRPQIWSDQPPLSHRGPSQGSPEHFPPRINNSWGDYNRPQQAYQPPHYGHHPSQPPSHHGPPQPNGGPPYGRYDHHASHQPYQQPNGSPYDRPPPRSGPPPPPPSQHPQTPRFQHNQHHVPAPPPHHGAPHHHNQGPPPPFGARASGSPFSHHPSNVSNPSSTPQMPQGASPAPSMAQPAVGGGPSTPKPPPALGPDGRPGASNSPHIGNLLS